MAQWLIILFFIGFFLLPLMLVIGLALFLNKGTRFLFKRWLHLRKNYHPQRDFISPTEDDLRLAEELKQKIPWMHPFKPLDDPTFSAARELQREVGSPQHQLYGKKVIPLGHSIQADDVLYKIVPGEEYAWVHLTHSKETSGIWPNTNISKDFKAMVKALKEANEWHEKVAKEREEEIIRETKFYIDFKVDNIRRFKALQKVFYELKKAKRVEMGMQPTLLDDEKYWLKFFDQKARKYFKSLPDGPSTETGSGKWDFGSMLESIKEYEFDLISCELVPPAQDNARLVFNPLAHPYGSTGPLEGLIEAFGFKVKEIRD